MKAFLTMNKPYFIIEAANSHGGNFDYLIELVDSFKNYKKGFGMKFQPFSHDEIATKDFPYYEIYKKLHFNKLQWKQIIEKVSNTKDVWLDLFDSYGVTILQKNLDNIIGIKFQSSVIFNLQLFQLLSKVKLDSKKIIINVAALPLDKVREAISEIEKKLNPQEILIEFGYQAYPTELKDSGISKLEVIRTNFSNRIVFADHVDGKSDDAIWLPVVVTSKGVDVIEKHVMLNDRKTEYDHFSSLTPERFDMMVKKVATYSDLMNKPFINEKEIEYLKSTIMIPILKKDKQGGTLFNFQEDFEYKRSGQKGLNLQEIRELQRGFHLLATDKKAGETVQKEDFRKAVIATVIACRLKSTRLPRKATLLIGNLPSVERCIKSCLEFNNVNHTIIATSVLEEDAELKNYTFRKDVVFYQGDPDDVIRRYLGIAKKLKIDIIIRVTADMPFVSHEIVNLTLNQHFENGADYTVPVKAAVGTAAEVMNVKALQEIKKYFRNANYSEYMTWYFQNNPEHFNLNFFDLPANLISDYRLTLDYPEDLEMFNHLEKFFIENKKTFDLKEAFGYLDQNPEIRNINAHFTLKYKTDQTLINKLNIVTKIKS